MAQPAQKQEDVLLRLPVGASVVSVVVGPAVQPLPLDAGGRCSDEAGG